MKMKFYRVEVTKNASVVWIVADTEETALDMGLSYMEMVPDEPVTITELSGTVLVAESIIKQLAEQMDEDAPNEGAVAVNEEVPE